MGYQKF
jgi:hypothetical protein